MRCTRRWICGLAAAGTILGGLAEVPVRAAEPEVVQVEVIAGEAQAPPPQQLAVFVGQATSHWIGGHFVPLEELVKSQLNLDHGLAAMHVVPDSPAAKAGIQQHDILLTFDGTKISDVEGLLQAVEKAQGKEVEARILRGGSERTLKIKPEARPENAGIAALMPGEFDVQQLLKRPLGDMARWLDKDGVRMLLVKPGVVVPRDAVLERPFPKNLSVTVTKDGDKPAVITVKRGEDGWEVTEGQLEKLPEDIRVFVEPMVTGKGQMRIQIRSQVEQEEDVQQKAGGDGEKRVEIRRFQVIPGPGQPGLPPAAGPAGQPRIHFAPRAQVVEEHKASDEGLDALRKEMQQLRRELQQLKKGLEAKSK